MKRMEIRASVECLCRVPGAHHVPPTCKQTECMRTAHVGAVRIYEFHGLSSRRASNQEVVIVYSSWPRQILFSRQITFSFFSTRLTLFVSTLPYHFSLCRLFIISPPPRLHPPFPLSTTRRFLRQVLCTYINSSSVSLRDPLPPSLPAIRFEEIDSSPVYDVLSNRVNTKRPSSSLKLGISPLCTTGDDFYLHCFPHVTYPAGSSPRGNRVGQRYLVAPRAASFRDKGPPDNRGYFKDGPEGSLYSAEESGVEENVQMPIHASGKWLVEINLEEPSLRSSFIFRLLFPSRRGGRLSRGRE